MKFIVISIVSLVFLWTFVRYMEKNSVFFPTKEIPVTPIVVGLGFEDIYFKTADGLLLNGWFIKSPGAKSTLIYFHGNAGNIGHRLEKILLFHQLPVNIFIIDYRGYGKSQGHPSESGIYQDALSAYDYLISRKDIDSSALVSYGDSLGGVAAIDLATKRKVAALIVDSSFSSCADVSRCIFPFIPAWFLTIKMNSALKVKDLKIPKLFIHSINDEIIPFRLGRKLFDSAAEPKEFLQIIGGHNTNHIDSKELLLNGMKNFLKKNNLL